MSSEYRLLTGSGFGWFWGMEFWVWIFLFFVIFFGGLCGDVVGVFIAFVFYYIIVRFAFFYLVRRVS